MSGPSSIGFGHQPFGSEQFGSADWAEEVTWKIIPEFYRDLDAASAVGLVPAPLRGFIDSIKPLFQEIRAKLGIFPSLWDASECPFPQLPALAYNVGLSITSVETLSLIQVLPAPFTQGEEIKGSVSGSTGFISSITQSNFTIIGIKGAGFKVGESITGLGSGYTAKIISASGSGSSQLITLQTFVVGESIIGSRTGTTGVIGSVSINSINVSTVTGTGFINGEEITGKTSFATGVVNGVTSDGKTEQLLRSQVLNAVQLWTKKGTSKGHAIIAAFEGLLVLVTPLWSVSCDPDPLGQLLMIEPPPTGTYIANFDAELADSIPMDRFYIDEFDAWPRDVDNVEILPGLPEGPCRSYSLRLFLFTPDDTEIENFDAVSARILNNLENFKPIHVRFDRVTFDGPRAASTKWLASPVIAESYAAGKFVTVSPITGSLSAASSKYTLFSFSATNP